VQTLFTPWRFDYLTAPKSENTSCIFCAAAAAGPGASTLTLYRGEHSLVMLNRYPYTNGHLMVSPVEHTADFHATRPDTLFAVFRTVAFAQRLLAQTYSADGFNIGMNLGRAAGAGIEDHYHVHVVPRWGGDSNFMSVTASTRIVPETLEQTFEKLLPKFEELTQDFLRLHD
jgi:ATP adenylyltransferase